jgi:hypothetical protein
MIPAVRIAGDPEFKKMKTLPILIGAAAICLLIAGMAPAALHNDPPKGEIVVTSALFGNGIKVADVTQRVSELLNTEPGGFSARGDWLRADPIPYKIKAFVIAYDYKGKHYMFLIPGGEKVSYKRLVENAER